MPFLYEKIDGLRDAGFISQVPSYVINNLNQNFEIRPYQMSAFENYITYFGNEKLRQKPTQTLFHMATGSGKTLIMAGLMLYLYKKGYRNFLFFVNLSNIVRKTKENFLNPKSGKYLFSNEIIIDGERVSIKEVNNFQDSDDRAINICFTTTQGLHSDMWSVRENSLSLDDFTDKRIVLISDEAHHLNADTMRNNEERENSKSWEYTVNYILGANSENVLLEFTATCDLENQYIKAAYENKIIYDYPLHKFRADGYSKEIKTLRSDLSIEDRSLQALIISQYRYKVFQEYRQNVKPVIMFKSKLVKENAENMKAVIKMVHTLSGDRIERLFEQSASEILAEAHKYFLRKGISYDELAAELKADFSEEHCISANDDKDVERNQLLLNSLEDKSNPYRAVFAVDKLNEGWDVLNLFDIVRLYETRDGRNNRPGKTTIKEAQLIGRGARYCPFQIDDEQPRYQRKYDEDVDNPLRICEVMYYHCWNENRYINELHTALREIGLDIEANVTREYVLKEEFKQDDIFKEGYIFVNDRILVDRRRVFSLPEKIRDTIYNVRFARGKEGEDIILDENLEILEDRNAIHKYSTTFQKIADINYSIVNKALCRFDIFKFNILKQYFPNLKSTRDFIYHDAYLGNIRIDIFSKYEKPTIEMLFNACLDVLGKISESISGIEETYKGTLTFRPVKIRDVLKSKKCTYNNPHDGGIGVSQKDLSVPSEWRINLNEEDWFAFEDNFGTSEEKAFVAYFKDYVDELKEEYDKVFLLRNERQFHVYSFEDGNRFEPDFVLLLHKNKAEGYEQLQVFVEPKGTHLIENDLWKERFLLHLKSDAVPVKILKDDNDYFIWGFHFFNTDVRMGEFGGEMELLLDSRNIRKLPEENECSRVAEKNTVE